MMTDVPTDLRLDFDPSPTVDLRAGLGREINAFHSRTVPHDQSRFAFRLHDGTEKLVAGVVGVISWRWLFIEALWVADSLRGQGVGRALMTRAEAHARNQGCHSVWLDTFQASDFYLALGFTAFGVLDDYPPGQSRTFLRKPLGPPA